MASEQRDECASADDGCEHMQGSHGSSFVLALECVASDGILAVISKTIQEYKRDAE